MTNKIVKLAMILLSRLNRLKSAAEAYLYKTYGSRLNEYKSQDQRRIIIDDVLRQLVKKIDAFDEVADTASLVKENLHNTHFVLTNIKDLAEHFLREKISV